jgi:hypothetical protein
VGDSEATLSLLLRARNLASREVDKLHTSLDRTAKSKGFKSIVQGLGVGVGIGVFDTLTRSIGAVTDVIGDSITAALDEEESISKLTASLKANVKGWDGNTTAMESVLAARMKLGFSDDEQRSSLATLVVATHDVSKALDIQRTAMDLARLKGISLQEASDALIKVEGGQYRALKALGIVLPANATATEALAAVQAAAKGQADQYASTTKGKLLVAQVKVGEAMEKLGTVLLPVVADVMGAVSTAVEALAGFFSDTLVPALAQAGRGWDKLMGFIKPIVDAIKWLIDNTGKAVNAILDFQGYYVDETGQLKAKHRAMGGPVMAGRGYMVGEKGPEWFRPNVSGSIIPNNRMTAGGGGGPQTIYLVIDGKTVAAAVVPAVSRQMYYDLRRDAPVLSRA